VRIYVANLMTEPGETDRFTLDDHLHTIRLHAGYDLFDYIIVHSGQLASSAATRYAQRGSTPVTVDGPLKWAGRSRIVECDLAADCDGHKIRHAARPLARVIRGLIEAGRRA
jgi:2-phospho-L-lactate transferase/gluconeogenesis factor (CofD/UPF0052 family)